jgi:hypothetical protein
MSAISRRLRLKVRRRIFIKKRCQILLKFWHQYMMNSPELELLSAPGENYTFMAQHSFTMGRWSDSLQHAENAHFLDSLNGFES